jgi:beta-xylosidase
MSPTNKALFLGLAFLIMQHNAPASPPPSASGFVYPWVSDRGDGTYKNPILFADYSDPDAIRVGEDFYMVSSSFACTPGLPILHSKDLVNWKLIAHAFQNYPFPEFSAPQHGKGVWAPALRHHNGEFYIYFGDPDRGVFVTRAKNPAGPWSPLVCIQQAKGWIDTCPLWDDDGQAYLVHAWAKSRAGINSIMTINRLSPDGMKLLDEGTKVFDGHANHPTIEGPKLYKRNGYYYIFAPAGGVRTGWQTVLRSTNILGPYEDRVVLAQGSTNINGPHQGAWVDTPAGESWFLHFQDRGAYGRILHLQPMKWVNNWPVMGNNPTADGKGEPVGSAKKPNAGKTWPIEVPATTDEFDSPKLGLQWQWQANYRDDWLSLSARKGWLQLNAVPLPAQAVNLWPVPNLLLQKLPAESFTATTRLDFSKLAVGEKAGLAAMGPDYAYVAVERTMNGFKLFKTLCLKAPENHAEVVESETTCPGETVQLRVQINPGAVCHFSWSTDGKKFTPVGTPLVARDGSWIGAKVGLFCLSPGKPAGHADFDWFRFE